MKALSFHRLVILGVLIFASVLLAASATAQLPAPSPRPIMNATEETAVYPALGNPAAVYCREMGYEYQMEVDNGQRGFCTLPDGETCDAWEFLQGKCGQSYSFCAQRGYEILTVADGQDSLSPEYAVCVTGEGVLVGSVTELSNLSEKATGCGGETPGGEIPPVFEEGDEYVPPLDGDPPTFFDWRTYLGSNWLSPIRNQGSCGSCWAFSAVGVTEAAHNIANNNPDLDLNLSEQYLVADCSSAGTCCGGVKSYALQYIRDLGIPDEACMSYVDGTGCTCNGGTCDSVCAYDTGGNCSDRTCSNRCGDWSSRLIHIASMGYVGTDPQTIKQALVDTGPLAVSMGYGDDFDGRWDGDIYRCDSDTGTNHAVVAVGYSDAGGYWLIRNSWGTGWGDNGYFKLGYGECYVEQYVYHAEASPPDVGPLEYDSHLVDDDTNGESVGNGDGIADCGESIELYVDLINQGSDAATLVSATISTSDPYVTWLHNTSSDYPEIPGGGTGTNNLDFDFALDPDTPDGQSIQFNLDITASTGGPWTDSFDVPVTCNTNSPPYTPSSPSPVDGATGVSITSDLAWTGGDPDPGDTVTYDVYFGTANPPTTLLRNDLSSPTCDPGTLSYNAYYWYVVATDNHGASTSGPVWDFATTTGGDAYEPDDTWDQASSIDDGSPQIHSIMPADDVDWVMFSLATESEVVLETSGASGDTRMWLYDSGLTELEYDNDDGTDYFSRIDRVCGVDALPSGTYYVKVDEYGNNEEIPSYEIALTVQACASTVGPLEYDSHLIDDDTYNESFGDGDGIVECGESIELWVDLINQGTDAATLIDATISTGDPYVTWLHNTSSDYPEIPGGGTGTNINDYDFSVAAATPDGHIIQFDLEITSYDGGPWTDSFDVPVACNNPPNMPSSPLPADGATGVSITTDLSWAGGDPDPGDTVTYDVYFGTANPPTTLLRNDVSSPTCDPGTLSYNAHYYWYVVATDSHDASTSGPVWDFITTAGGDAYEPDDTSGQANWLWDGSPQTHSIVPAGDIDWVMFSLSAESEIVIETSGASGNTHMWLYDSGLNELEHDDDDGPDLFSRIDRLCGVDALPAGTYYVKIEESGNDDEIPSYDIAFTVAQACVSDVGPLEYDSHTVDDDTSTSYGDDDGIVDCGETIEINVILRNQGTDTATGVVASLSTTDSYITVTDPQEDFPDIAGGGTGEDIGDFDFVVDPATPDGHVTHFDLNITASNGGSWSDTFEVPVECSAVCNDPGESNDEPGQAVPISYGTVLSARDICPAGDLDYYSFSGEAGDTIVADIDARATVFSLLDSYMVLYGTDGVTELTHNDDFDGLDSQIAYTLPAAGTYYLMVREYSDPIEGGEGYTYQISLVDLDHAIYLPVVLRNQD